MPRKVGRPKTGRTPNFSIRINPDALHQARIRAVTEKKTLGKWLEVAITEKIERDTHKGGGHEKLE